jgi:CheY-like chemotaxis protein
MTIAIPLYPAFDFPLIWLAGKAGGSSDMPGNGSEELERIRAMKLNILVVDNNGPFRTSFLKKLGKVFNAVVDGADGGASALRKAAAQPDLDLILMDISMPVMNGFETYEGLRNNQVMARVVLMTAHKRPEYRERAAAMQLTILNKPIDDRELRQVLLSCRGKVS